MFTPRCCSYVLLCTNQWEMNFISFHGSQVWVSHSHCTIMMGPFTHIDIVIIACCSNVQLINPHTETALWSLSDIVVAMPTGNNDGQCTADYLLHRRHWKHCSPDGETPNASNSLTGLYRNYPWCSRGKEAVQDDMPCLWVRGCKWLKLYVFRYFVLRR